MTDRISALLAEVAALRAAEQAVAQDGSPSTNRAKRVYGDAVLRGGGCSAVAKCEGVDEAAVRRRLENPRLRVHLSHVYDMPPEAIERVSEDLRIAALEKKAMRRAG